jgi:hypothetical protein
MDDVLGPYPQDSYTTLFDVLISDIRPEDLHESVSDRMGVKYLSPALPPAQVKWPVHGKTYVGRKSDGKRVLFCLPVEASGKAVNVHFILDTGAPCTYIAMDVLKALGLSAVGNVVFKINGKKASFVRLSKANSYNNEKGELVKDQCNFEDLNILGVDFLDKINAVVTIDMFNETANIAMIEG